MQPELTWETAVERLMAAETVDPIKATSTSTSKTEKSPQDTIERL